MTNAGNTTPPRTVPRVVALTSSECPPPYRPLNNPAEPDVIRLAPVPLYNSFQDAFLFAERLKQALNPSSLGSRI